MQTDNMWSLFAETGDIVYYLIYRTESAENTVRDAASMVLTQSTQALAENKPPVC